MGADTDRGKITKVKCPTCGVAVKWQGNPNRPFCSERCQIADRAGWADEAYSLPSEDSPSSDEFE